MLLSNPTFSGSILASIYHVVLTGSVHIIQTIYGQLRLNVWLFKNASKILLQWSIRRQKCMPHITCCDNGRHLRTLNSTQEHSRPAMHPARLAGQLIGYHVVKRTEATFQSGKLQDKNLTGSAPLQQPNLSCRGLPCPNAWFCANHMPCRPHSDCCLSRPPGSCQDTKLVSGCL